MLHSDSRVLRYDLLTLWMEAAVSDQSNKELLILIGKSSLQLVKSLWHKLHPSRVTFTHWLLNLSFMLLNAAIMVGIAYLIVKSDPELLSHFASLGAASTETQTSGSSFWDILGAIGSILAGAGTLGLLFFGWAMVDDWKRQSIFNKEIDQMLFMQDQVNSLLNSYLQASYEFLRSWSVFTSSDIENEYRVLSSHSNLIGHEIDDLHKELLVKGFNIVNKYQEAKPSLNRLQHYCIGISDSYLPESKEKELNELFEELKKSMGQLNGAYKVVVDVVSPQKLKHFNDPYSIKKIKPKEKIFLDLFDKLNDMLNSLLHELKKESQK